MKKLLLHICCGPCAIYPFQTLTKEGFSTEGYFYNPNIQPLGEYLKRKQAVESLEKIFNIKIYFADYEQDSYLSRTQKAINKDSRCRSCFRLRLEKTHQFAEDNHFDFFTTTLLVSPYQDQQLIKEVADQIACDSKAQFLFYDFRPGFRQGHAKAKELNLYTQKYCGCLSSLLERSQEKRKGRADKVVKC